MYQNKTRVMTAALSLVAFLISMAPLLAQPAVPGGDASEVVSTLTKELGVTPEQARGGAGSLFSIAKGKMPAADFAQVAKAVPDMDALLKAAPAMGGGGVAEYWSEDAAAIYRMPVTRLIRVFMTARTRRYIETGGFATYGRGWIARAIDITAEAVEWASELKAKPAGGTTGDWHGTT